MVEPLQLIDGSGSFNAIGVEKFVKSTNLTHAGLDYQIVAIMGPQSSGKSTLLNHVFGTSFTMMDAFTGRQQTTKGIWVAKSPKLEELSTIILDLEGTDGRERGEDDTTFERQSALFALAVSDIVMVNIWCHDIGREHGAGKPLMKTVFQVNLKLFKPSPDRRKTVLVFVIRDKSKTPMERLVEVIEQDWDSIWKSITKPAHYENTSFKDFFEVHYTALPNYEDKEDDFKAESYMLRKKFEPGESESFVYSGEKLPGDALPLSTQKVWEVVKSQKDLDLPAHKIMVANTRCAEILEDQYMGLKNDANWTRLCTESKTGFVKEFGEQASSLVDSCLTGYDEEALYFDSEVRSAKRQELVHKVYEVVKPVFEEQVAHSINRIQKDFEHNMQVGIRVEKKIFSECASEYRAKSLDVFRKDFGCITVNGAEWPPSVYQTKVEEGLDSHVTQLKKEKVVELMENVDKSFMTTLAAPTADLLDVMPADLWKHLRSALDSAVTGGRQLVKKGVEGYDLPLEEWDSLCESIRTSAQKLQETSVKEVAHNALSRMKDRFSDEFNLDKAKLPRSWTARDNISQISKEARLAGSEVLAQLALLQFDDETGAVQEVERAVRAMAKKDLEEGVSGKSETENLNEAFSIIGIMEWPGVTIEKVLLSPQDVRSVWRRFMSDTKVHITQAKMTQQANKAAARRAPPLWAIAAMIVLGGNEMMAIVSSPLLALFIIVFLLFLRTLYIELDVDGEMQQGALPGLLSLSTKLLPAVKSVSSKTFTSVQGMFSEAAPSSVPSRPNAVRPTMESFAQQSHELASFKTPVRPEEGLRRRHVEHEGGIELAPYPSSEIIPDDPKDE